jgi:hypothetical protein
MVFRVLTGEEESVHQDKSGSPLEALHCRSHPLWSAPILADDYHLPELELVHEGDKVGDVVSRRKAGIDARVVGVSRPDPIGRDYTIAGFRQGPDKITVQKPPGRVTR